MSVVEQYARVQVLTDADDGGRSAPVVLRYDPEDDSRSIRMGLPGPRWFGFARELLEQGLRAPAGTGEVRVWPCGRVRAVVEVHAERGCSVVQFDTGTLLRFLRLTYAADRTGQPAAFSSAATIGPAVSPPCPPAWTTPAAARSSR